MAVDLLALDWLAWLLLDAAPELDRLDEAEERDSLDELDLLAELDELPEDDREELDELERLDDELDELDDLDELDELLDELAPQTQWPKLTASHRPLSAQRLAQPRVPGGTKSVLPPLEELALLLPVNCARRDEATAPSVSVMVTLPRHRGRCEQQIFFPPLEAPPEDPDDDPEEGPLDAEPPAPSPQPRPNTIAGAAPQETSRRVS